MKIFLLIIFLSIFFMCGSVFALDWISLHEQADIVNSTEALKIQQENPEQLEALYVLGLTYLNEFKNKEAEATFDQMLTVDPGSIEAQWGKAESVRRRRDFDQSQKILDNVIAADYSFAPAYISLAYINYIKMNFDESVQLAVTVIKFGKENVDLTNFVRAHCLVAGAKGMIAHYGGPVSKVINGRSVLPYLKKAEKLDPDAPAVLFGLGSYYFLIPRIFGRNIDKAEEYLLQAVKVDPNFPDIYVRLAQIAQLRNDNEKYKEYLSKALSLDPENELAKDIERGKCDFICITTEK
ncbi:tetratricopeptide repeat protein [Candidatus Omnitrophota bacterium]